MQQFISFLSQISHLSHEAQDAIKGKLTTQYFSKNQILVNELSECKYLYFIEKGLARIYYLKDGKEITDWFGFENTIVGPVMRNHVQKPGPHQVELLEDSIVTSIHFDDLQILFDQFHEIERIGRIIALQAVLALQQRLDSIQFETAQQRYQNLLKTNPSILQRVSLGHIASFLGITQVTLSRIRAKV
jgi:CRP-like cAMP-binding protein